MRIGVDIANLEMPLNHDNVDYWDIQFPRSGRPFRAGDGCTRYSSYSGKVVLAARWACCGERTSRCACEFTVGRKASAASTTLRSSRSGRVRQRSGGGCGTNENAMRHPAEGPLVSCGDLPFSPAPIGTAAVCRHTQRPTVLDRPSAWSLFTTWAPFAQSTNLHSALVLDGHSDRVASSGNSPRIRGRRPAGNPATASPRLPAAVPAGWCGPR